MLTPPSVRQRPQSRAHTLLVGADGYLTVWPAQHVASAVHRHHLVQVTIALVDEFPILLDGSTWTSHRALALPSNYPHAIGAHSTPLLNVFFDPLRMASRLDAPASVPPELAREAQALAHESDSYARGVLLGRVAAWLDCAGRAAGPLDPRVRATADALGRDASPDVRVDDVAAREGLSASRLGHLFSEAMGMTLPAFRVWSRLRHVIDASANGSPLLDAALAAGFSDQAHFCRAFKSAFGVAPSFVLGNTTVVARI